MGGPRWYSDFSSPITAPVYHSIESNLMQEIYFLLYTEFRLKIRYNSLMKNALASILFAALIGLPFALYFLGMTK